MVYVIPSRGRRALTLKHHGPRLCTNDPHILQLRCVRGHEGLDCRRLGPLNVNVSGDTVKSEGLPNQVALCLRRTKNGKIPQQGFFLDFAPSVLRRFSITSKRTGKDVLNALEPRKRFKVLGIRNSSIAPRA